MKKKDKKIKISIIIPIFNSEKTIGRIVEELVKELSHIYILEIILINDASEDMSEKVCIDSYQKYQQIVRFFSLARNVGEHNALMAGLGKAEGEYIITMDDDFQNPVKEVIRLIKTAINYEYDVVYTYSHKSGRSFFRKLGSIFSNLTAGIILKKPAGLYLSSFKCINYFTAKKIIEYDLPFTYIDGLILCTAEKIGKLKVEEHKRREGKSGYSIRKLFSLWLNMFFGFATLPLKLFVFISVLFLIVVLILGLILLLKTVNYISYSITWLWIALIITAVSIIHFMVLWMLGEYLVRNKAIQSKMPQYNIVKSYESVHSKNE